MNKFNKFFRSKQGKWIASLLGLLVIIIAMIAVYLGDIGGLSGTGGLAHVTTCLPTCDETDAKMFILAGSNQASMSNTPIKIWIAVPGDQDTFTLGIFDGDTSKGTDNTLVFNAAGNFSFMRGNWDDAWDSDTTYSLYADPLADGSGQMLLASWMGNDMLNNAWWETTITNDGQAQAPNLNYYYRLEATRPLEGKGGQAFKVRATGYLMTGQREEWTVGFTGMLGTLNDVKVIYPESNGVNNLGSKTTYDGDWQLYFYIPVNVPNFEIWDGDFDRGSVLDTDDPNTVGKPDWATNVAVDEGIGGLKHDGVGNPNDDNKTNHFRVSPEVSYEIVDPLGQPIYFNENPSGTEEWEKYTVSSNPGESPDLPVSDMLKAGMYSVHVTGLDLHNFIWVSVNYPICDPNGGCPPPPWGEGSCPRTIGYWKNNVKKIYIDNRTKGIQESQPSLDWGLRNVALASTLYRSGLNVKNPTPIATATPLTPAEANAILQKTNGNSMLDRALQQTLAAWLNLASGKIGAYNHIRITGIAGGDFEGTMMEALRFSEGVILDPAKRADTALLERAKDISDMINNNMLTNTSEPDALQACTVYENPTTGVVPKDKQPPTHDKMPKAPKSEPPVVEPNPAPMCTAGNAYNVENTTNNPFYSVKFNFTSGTEIKDGAYDIFKYTLPADVVAAMSNTQVEIKAADDTRIYELACDFTSPDGCGLPVGDDAYSVSFDGASDNGDGTYTLTFSVYVYGQHGLSHVAFSLPDGQTAGGVNENYNSESCIVP